MAAEQYPPDAEDDRSTNATPPPPDEGDIREYEEIMRGRMPSIPPVDMSWLTSTAHDLSKKSSTQLGDDVEPEREDEKSMSKAEKQKAKKKRRKERERAARLTAEAAKGSGGTMDAVIPEETDAPVSFRLFSARPVEAISIVRLKEDYSVPENPRHLPLPHLLSDKIHQIALSSAAAWDLSHLQSIANQISSTASEEAHLRALPSIRLSAATGASKPNLIHILPSHTSLPPVQSKKAKSTLLPPIVRIARIPDSNLLASKVSHRQRRRLTRAQPYDLPSAQYWAPEVGLGGKARGYAYGWAGSQEGRREQGRGYVKS